MRPRLLTIDEAADQLGVPAGSLETAARRHGFLVKMGRATRIDPDTLGELIKLCRENPQARDSTSAPLKGGEPVILSSAMADNSCQRALATAEKLRARSRGTSRSGTGPPARVIPLK